MLSLHSRFPLFFPSNGFTSLLYPNPYLFPPTKFFTPISHVLTPHPSLSATPFPFFFPLNFVLPLTLFSLYLGLFFHFPLNSLLTLIPFIIFLHFQLFFSLPSPFRCLSRIWKYMHMIYNMCTVQCTVYSTGTSASTGNSFAYIFVQYLYFDLKR